MQVDTLNHGHVTCVYAISVALCSLNHVCTQYTPSMSSSKYACVCVCACACMHVCKYALSNAPLTDPMHARTHAGMQGRREVGIEDYMDVRTRCADVWMRGSVDAWVHGRMDAWKRPSISARTCTYASHTHV